MNTIVFKIVGITFLVALMATIFILVVKSDLNSADIEKLIGIAFVLAIFGTSAIYLGFFAKPEFVFENESIENEDVICKKV